MRRDYISISAGTVIYDTDGEEVTLQHTRSVFANMRDTVCDYRFQMYYNPDNGYDTFSVPWDRVVVLPVHRKFAQENFESTIIKAIDAQNVQTVVYNPPRYFPDGKPYRMPPLPHMTSHECAAAFPNLVKAMGIGSYLASHEADFCLRYYRDGFQFGGDAVSYHGGTPLDAIVNTIRGMGALLSGRHDLGNEMVYMFLDQNTGWLDLAAIDTWMKFMLERYQEKRETEHAR